MNDTGHHLSGADFRAQGHTLIDWIADTSSRSNSILCHRWSNINHIVAELGGQSGQTGTCSS